MSTCFSPKEGKRTGAVTLLWSCSARAVYSWVAAEWLKWPGLLSELTVKSTWWLLVLSGGRMVLLRSSGLGKKPRVCSWWEVTYSVLWFSTEKINRCVQMLSCTMTLKAPNRGHFPCKLLWSHSFPNEENQWMIAGCWKWMVVIRMLSLLWGRAEKGRELVVTKLLWGPRRLNRRPWQAEYCHWIPGTKAAKEGPRQRYAELWRLKEAGP